MDSQGSSSFANPIRPQENFLNQWDSRSSQDLNNLFKLGNEHAKLDEKIRLPNSDKRDSKKSRGIPFSVKDLQGIIYDFLSPKKSFFKHESQLSDALETNTGKILMVENFLYLFTSYLKTLKDQRLQILQNLTQIKDSDSYESTVKRSRLDDSTIVNSKRVREAFYSVAQVYEMDVNDVTVIRRKKDDWVNATTILKAAGICKGRKKRKTLESISGNVQIIQGGYWKLQGTWIPLENARLLARFFDLHVVLSPILDF